MVLGMTPTPAPADEMVRAVRAWASENYERGGDVIVEAFADREVLNEVVRDATTVGGAIANAREFCGLHEEQRANVLSQSGEHDAEAAAHMRNARSLG